MSARLEEGMKVKLKLGMPVRVFATAHKRFLDNNRAERAWESRGVIETDNDKPKYGIVVGKRIVYDGFVEFELDEDNNRTGERWFVPTKSHTLALVAENLRSKPLKVFVSDLEYCPTSNLETV